MRPIQYPTEEMEWIKAEVKTLKRKGVIADAVPDAYLHRVVLVSGRPDRPLSLDRNVECVQIFAPLTGPLRLIQFPFLISKIAYKEYKPPTVFVL